jgi:starvation-inducible DNA-binding protein
MAQVEHAYATHNSTSTHRTAANKNDAGDTSAIVKSLNALLADSFALYLKTKNFHWHVVGPHFRPYHLLFDEHAEELFSATDELAERVRAIGALPGRADIGALRRVRDRERPSIRPQDMLSELLEDNDAMANSVREAHGLCARQADTASASLLEALLDKTERRRDFLCEIREESEQDGLF